jgi:hypothetical protein
VSIAETGLAWHEDSAMAASLQLMVIFKCFIMSEGGSRSEPDWHLGLLDPPFSIASYL